MFHQPTSAEAAAPETLAEWKAGNDKRMEWIRINTKLKENLPALKARIEQGLLDLTDCN